MKDKEAKRYNSSKPMLECIHPMRQEGEAQVYTYGAIKYAPWNFTEGGGLKPEQLIGSVLRHLNPIHMAFYNILSGKSKIEDEDIKQLLVDSESGLPHLAHLMCSLNFIAHFFVENGLEDCVRANEQSFSQAIEIAKNFK